MASYFRSLFGGQPSSSTAHSHSSSKSRHSRSASSPPTGSPYFRPSQTTHTADQVPHTQRSDYSCSRTKRPSPLRYNSYDTTTTQIMTQSMTSAPRYPTRPPLYKSTTYSPGDQMVHYPIFHSTSSFGSSRTGSTSSIQHASSASGHSIASNPTTSVSGPRPALKQSHTWSSGSRTAPKPHVSFQNPNRVETLNMHPLLASSRHTPAPISYDVLNPPSHHSIVDRSTRTSVPAHTLAQPATDPPSFSKIVLKSDKFPWTIITQSASKTTTRFFIAGSSPRKANPISNLDVLNAVHQTLAARVTQEEWAALGQGSRAQRKATRAYEQRCNKTGDWDNGVRRVDMLGEKTILIGVEIDKSAAEGRVAKLLFGRA